MEKISTAPTHRRRGKRGNREEKKSTNLPLTNLSYIDEESHDALFFEKKGNQSLRGKKSRMDLLGAGGETVGGKKKT